MSRFLRNSTFHYRTQKSPQLVPILNQMNPVHTLPSYFLRFILLQSFRLHLGFLSCLLPSGFPTKIFYAFFISPVHAICTAHLILLDLITLVIFGEAYKVWSSSICSLLQPPETSSLLGPNILLSTLFSNTLDLFFPLCETEYYKTLDKKWWNGRGMKGICLKVCVGDVHRRKWGKSWII